MGNANCGQKARRRAAAMAAANRRTGQAAAGSNQIEQQLTSSDLSASAQSGYGGFGFAMDCPQGIDQDVALLATAAALAVGIYVVYRHAIPLTQSAGVILTQNN